MPSGHCPGPWTFWPAETCPTLRANHLPHVSPDGDQRGLRPDRRTSRSGGNRYKGVRLDYGRMTTSGERGDSLFSRRGFGERGERGDSLFSDGRTEFLSSFPVLDRCCHQERESPPLGFRSRNPEDHDHGPNCPTQELRSRLLSRHQSSRRPARLVPLQESPGPSQTPAHDVVLRERLPLSPGRLPDHGQSLPPRRPF